MRRNFYLSAAHDNLPVEFPWQTPYGFCSVPGTGTFATQEAAVARAAEVLAAGDPALAIGVREKFDHGKFHPTYWDSRLVVCVTL